MDKGVLCVNSSEYHSLYRSINLLHSRPVAQNRASQYVCQEWIIGLPEVIIPAVLGEAKVLRAVLSLAMSRFLHGHQHAVQILSFPMCHDLKKFGNH